MLDIHSTLTTLATPNSIATLEDCVYALWKFVTNWGLVTLKITSSWHLICATFVNQPCSFSRFIANQRRLNLMKVTMINSTTLVRTTYEVGIFFEAPHVKPKKKQTSNLASGCWAIWTTLLNPIITRTRTIHSKSSDTKYSHLFKISWDAVW